MSPTAQEDDSNDGGCPWPFLHPPACTSLVKDDARAMYTFWQKFYFSFGVIGVIVCICIFRNYVVRGTTSQRVVYPFLLVIPASYLVRSVDPAGEGNILSYTYFAFSEAVADASLVTVTILSCSMWFNMGKSLMKQGCVARRSTTLTVISTAAVWGSFLFVAYFASRRPADPGLNMEFAAVFTSIAMIYLIYAICILAVGIPMNQKMKEILAAKQQQLQANNCHNNREEVSATASYNPQNPFSASSLSPEGRLYGSDKAICRDSNTPVSSGKKIPRNEEPPLACVSTSALTNGSSTMKSAYKRVRRLHGLISACLVCTPWRSAWEGSTKIMKTMVVLVGWVMFFIAATLFLAAICFFPLLPGDHIPKGNRYFQAFHILMFPVFFMFLVFCWIFYVPRKESVLQRGQGLEQHVQEHHQHRGDGSPFENTSSWAAMYFPGGDELESQSGERQEEDSTTQQLGQRPPRRVRGKTSSSTSSISSDKGTNKAEASSGVKTRTASYRQHGGGGSRDHEDDGSAAAAAVVGMHFESSLRPYIVPDGLPPQISANWKPHQQQEHEQHHLTLDDLMPPTRGNGREFSISRRSLISGSSWASSVTAPEESNYLVVEEEEISDYRMRAVTGPDGLYYYGRRSLPSRSY